MHWGHTLKRLGRFHLSLSNDLVIEPVVLIYDLLDLFVQFLVTRPYDIELALNVVKLVFGCLNCTRLLPLRLLFLGSGLIGL